MGMNAELGINSTLITAFKEVLGHAPTAAEPVVILAAYMHSLVNEYGLTDSQHLDPDQLELPQVPMPARDFIEHFLPYSGNIDSLRNALYEIFSTIAHDVDLRARINKSSRLTEREVLLLAQVSWNLEQNSRRPKLPLRPRRTTKDGRAFALDIPVPNTDEDFATMRWTARSNHRGVPGKSAGASFRGQTARLAVLAAEWLVDTSSRQVPDIGDASFLLDDDKPRTQRIVWAAHLAQQSSGLTEAGVVPFAPNAKVMPSTVPKPIHDGPVLVGDFAEIGGHYQVREFEDEITRLWDDGGDRRVWLRGGPGLGKSYAARKIMQQALVSSDGERHDLLIWVDSADAVAATREFSRAAERLGNGLGSSVETDAPDREDQLAHALIDHLRTSDMRWLIVLDDADAEDLVEHRLIPPGTNPKGRVLITTVSASHRIAGAGRQVEAELFTSGEAEEFLENRLPDISEDERAGLSVTVRHHPLALSIAASTIAANSMTVSNWIEEFYTASRMDEAADYSDVGGYPRLISATWHLALERASQGMLQGMVERAAMVAALQDPDGHPTWLWQREDVRDWVAGGADAAPNRTRMHPCIRRLIDYGIIRLIGDWQDGRLSIHQLAARAIREAAAPEQLAELGALVADQWLLELTSNPANAQPKDIRAAMGPIAALPNLATTARDTAAALLGFSQPSTSELVHGWDRAELELLRPHLLQGGVMGRADLAERLADLGRGERDLGRHNDAHKNLAEAAAIYGHLAETPDLSNDLRADYLESLADIDAELNRPEQAHERRTNAAKLRERFEASEIVSGKPLSNLLALADLYHKMSDTQAVQAALDRALSLWEGQTPADTGTEASFQARLGRRLASIGRLAEAERCMRKAVELYATTLHGRTIYAEGLATELGYICAQTRRWGEAEDWFAKSGSDIVPLASVLLHQGRLNDARSSLAHAAKLHTEGAVRPEPDKVDAEIREEIPKLALTMLRSLTQEALECGRRQDAADLSIGCLDLTRAHADLCPGEDPQGLAQAYFLAGFTAREAKRADLTVEFFTKSASILELLVQITPSEDLDFEYGRSLYFLATSSLETGTPVSAARHARCAVEVLGGLASQEVRPFLSMALSVLGRACLEEDVDGAVAAFRRRVQICQAAHEETPSADTASSLADALKMLWTALLKTQRLDEAVQPLIATVTLYRAMSISEPETHVALAQALFFLAYVHDARERPQEASSFAEQAAYAWKELLDVEPTNIEHQISLAQALMMLSECLRKLGRETEAIRAAIGGANHLQLSAELAPDDHGSLLMQLFANLERRLRTIGRGNEADEFHTRGANFARSYPQLAGDE